jgi:hypothetical protein
MNKKEMQAKLDEIQAQQQIKCHEEALNRARSVTVGTAFGGSTELTMRGMGSTFTYAILQPVEVVELIHQLAANIGCHLNLQPRGDFASWRDWNHTEGELNHFRGLQSMPGVGHPPPSRLHPPPPHTQKLSKLEIKEEDQHAVATKKVINKRSAKQSPDAS